MRLAAIQFRSALLDRDETSKRIVRHIHAAAEAGADAAATAAESGEPICLYLGGEKEKKKRNIKMMIKKRRNLKRKRT